MNRVAFSLCPVPPFRLDLTVWTLRRRPDNTVDRWDGQTYRRALLSPSGVVDVAVTQVEPAETPRLRVSVEGQPLGSEVKVATTSAVERLLGLRVDLAGFYRLDRLADAGFLQPGSPRPHASGSHDLVFQNALFTGGRADGT